MNNKRRLLIADDNRSIVSILEEYALKEGFEVIRAYDGYEALKAARENSFDMMLLDVMMPGLDGFDVCRIIRRDSDVPIVLVTARTEDYDRIMGLDIGADDYIVKPFSPAEVMARVRAVLRRIPQDTHEQHSLTISGLSISLDEYRTELNGERIPLTRRETELLWLLASNRGRVFSRDVLLEQLWGFDYDGDARTVDSHVKRLRAKLDKHEHRTWSIQTIWGVGYKFEVNS